MSYCMFENTYHELVQCLEALSTNKELSERELKFKRKLLELCKDIASEFTDILED